MANKLTVTYNWRNIINEALIDGNAVVNYNNSNIATVTAGQTKTLKCSGKVMATDVGIGGKTLKCSGKSMASDVTVKLVPSRLDVYESGKRFLSAGSIVSGSSYSKEYSFKGACIEIGGGKAGKVTIQGIDFTNYSKINFECWANTSAEEPEVYYYYVGYGNTKTQGSDKVMKAIPKSRKTISFDIKNVTGQKYIYLGCEVSGGAYVDIYNIWLE